MSYNVTLILTLYTKSKFQFVSGYRDIELPFTPFIGLSIFKGAFDFGDIQRITWLEDQNRFSCSIVYVPKSNDEDLEFLIKMAKKIGYQGFDHVYDSTENS